ncbi:N-acetylglucosamine-6-phosphate deacetylase [Marvinbryantia formatexigens DSM 14469]|uniref:N-acetylglucosamine-6-phosphate deacetylase n=1 Tax=Marvinbryantia formatexigens DSM 14469 TaxID=478749 RepID=C6LCT9_9FIRM|nr:N-acetylglucosamine-6-phosphate deacetylase [Marvinbryantia formatexigens]EET61753.1 N-acetylglucosamine-6-phosphate deacetylase [Marvinbryantia formatexigens DSM 14469]UWO24437.1 N-acetylglucosamine-6-phosphate deacetylase [Marvinbryantia formatexigens DSM 14469]SDF07641.1 N-acetylglucosamine-6-phosphate deacetylase [Marvinbryantia formatexigens]
MIIKNGLVYGEDFSFKKADIQITGESFGEIAPQLPADEKEQIIDAEGLYVIPGLVDIHFHGCAGYDFCDGTVEAFDAIMQYEMEHGVTSVSPATMTLSEGKLAQVFENAGKYENNRGSQIRGITMEGPFVSMAKKGAQNASYIHRPDMRFFEKMQKLSGGMIRQVAVAPEEDKDFAFIKEVKEQTCASVAHTTADYDTAAAAFAAGACHVTHLFNAMPPFSHRAPGVIGAAFDAKNVSVELICDGIHVHPSMVRAAFAMFGAERICMISDSMMATGMENGDYALGGQPVKVVGRLATLKDGTIAGSASNLLDCLRVAVKDMGIPLADAVRACTATPAQSLGFYGECGSISAGKSADLVLLDKELNLVQVICRGAAVHK